MRISTSLWSHYVVHLQPVSFIAYCASIPLLHSELLPLTAPPSLRPIQHIQQVISKNSFLSTIVRKICSCRLNNRIDAFNFENVGQFSKFSDSKRSLIPTDCVGCVAQSHNAYSHVGALSAVPSAFRILIRITFWIGNNGVYHCTRGRVHTSLVSPW